jgi:hypothetical protein
MIINIDSLLVSLSTQTRTSSTSKRSENREYPLLESEEEVVLIGDILGKGRKMVAHTNNVAPAQPVEGSCSTLQANLDLVLAQYLGMPFPACGKAAVMSVSNGGREPRFSKLSGVSEWANCVYLWVNLGGQGSYANFFSRDGEQMMWYGGRRMTTGTICLHCYSFRG